MAREWRGLPRELILDIVQLAVLPPFLDSKFLPPPVDIQSLRGFVLASKACYQLFQIYKNDTVYLNEEVPLKKQIAELSPSVKHLYIHDFWTLPEYLSSCVDLREALQRFPQLRSLSIPSIIELGGCLPQVERCEIRCNRPGAITNIILLRSKGKDIISLVFPNLIELRLTSQQAIQDQISELDCVASFVPFSSIDSSSATYLEIFGGLKRLTVLKLDITLERGGDLMDIIMAHYDSVEHLQPSEGYTRSFNACSLCDAQIDHARVTEKEDEVTLALANEVSTLRSIYWLDIWHGSHILGQGRRPAHIERKNNKIILLRSTTG